MYIIMVRSNQAEKMLRDWAQAAQCQVHIEGNRMRLFEQHSLDRFHLDWPHAWENVVIWDCWNRRHIYND